MPLWLTVIVFAILGASIITIVVLVAGYVWGNWKRRTKASAEHADKLGTAAGSIQPEWDQKAAHTDSWIWR